MSCRSSLEMARDRCPGSRLVEPATWQAHRATQMHYSSWLEMPVGELETDRLRKHIPGRGKLLTEQPVRVRLSPMPLAQQRTLSW